MLNEAKLKSAKQILTDIDELQERKKQILESSDDSIIKYVMDLDIRLISSGTAQDMADVTEAYRITMAQLIDKEIDKKADLLQKIKLKKDEQD